MKKSKLTESDLYKIVKNSVYQVLKENTEINKQDDDNYYGGGLPEPRFTSTKYTCEKEVNEIYKQVKPYLDKLADVFNNYDCDNREIYDKVINALDVMDSLPVIAKQFYNMELDT